MAGEKTDTVLKINSISVSFDGFYALTEVEIAIQRGTIHFLIGPNGAGKTTLLDIICAKTIPTVGTVSFYPKSGKRRRLTGMKEHEITRTGIGRKFQVPSVFVNLTVWDNLLLSLKSGKSLFSSIFGRPSKEDIERIENIIQKVGLAERRDELAGSLAHGEKQWLEIAMQLVGEPELIMLDEPAAGMGKTETFKIGEFLHEIKEDCTIIVVEHDMEFVKKFADTVTVLHEGMVISEGDASYVLADKTVQSVYLGRGGER